MMCLLERNGMLKTRKSHKTVLEKSTTKI